MNKQRIIDLMDNPTLILESELPILQEMVERYPYSSTLRMLYLSGLNQTEDIRTDDELMHTAIHAPNRKRLRDLMQVSRLVGTTNSKNIPSNISEHDDDQKQSVIEFSEHLRENVASEPVVDIQPKQVDHQSLEEDQEQKLKKTKTLKSAEEIQLEKQYVTKAIESSIKLDVSGGNTLPSREDLADLKRFTPNVEQNTPSTFSDFLSGAQGPKITSTAQEISGLSKKKKSFYNPEKMAQDSLIDRVDFMTETLADIYLRQGYYAKAIRAFEHLRLKYPEKSTYFADRIAKIKKAIA